MDNQKIEIGPDFSIIRLSNEDKAAMLSHSRDASSWQQTIASSQSAFELFVKVPKVIGKLDKRNNDNFPGKISKNKFDKVCTALRLFKKGNVGYGDIQLNNAYWEPHGGSLRIGFSSSRNASGSLYTLSNSEIGAFLKFWRQYSRILDIASNRVEVALRRLNFSYERARPEDKLIDYLIGFEALLFLKNEKDELSYKLSLRGSALLAKYSEQKENIFNELRVAYRERSNIVHGSSARKIIKIGSQELVFNDFVQKIEEYLRSSIKKFLTVYYRLGNESEVIRYLDKKIVRGSSKLAIRV